MKQAMHEILIETHTKTIKISNKYSTNYVILNG